MTDKGSSSIKSSAPLIKMNLERYLLPALLMLEVIVGSNASLSSSVHRGLTLETALQRARTTCPEKLDSSKIQKVKGKIHKLLSPLNVASDPNRKAYRASYVESQEAVNHALEELCGLGVSEDPATFEQPNTGDEEIGDGESASTIYEKKEETMNSFNLNGYVLFIFGFVSGMLLVFVYFTQKNQPPVQNVKSLRRPEL